MAENDVYELIDQGTLDGQECLNVYFYRQAAPALAGPSSAQQLCDSFIATMIIPICAIQGPGMLHQAVKARNLFTPSDIGQTLISFTGSSVVGPDTAAPFNAVGFKLVNDNGAIRPGSKRYPAMPEGADTNGVLTNTSFLTALTALGVLLSGGLDAGIVSNAFIPIIVKRILESGEYRLPENSGESVIGNITEALFSANTTSQTTRKIGRGA